jgi:hypothetical protein
MWEVISFVTTGIAGTDAAEALVLGDFSNEDILAMTNSQSADYGSFWQRTGLIHAMTRSVAVKRTDSKSNYANPLQGLTNFIRDLQEKDPEVQALQQRIRSGAAKATRWSKADGVVKHCDAIK